MSKLSIVAMCICAATFPSAAIAAPANEPVKITAGAAAGPAFDGPNVHSEGPAKYLEMARSSDSRFLTGLYKSTATEESFESYPNDEFCYFLSGEATLTSADGAVTKIRAGDSVFIPKGWKGKWTTAKGFSKFFAIYLPAGTPPPGN